MSETNVTLTCGRCTTNCVPNESRSKSRLAAYVYEEQQWREVVVLFECKHTGVPCTRREEINCSLTMFVLRLKSHLSVAS